MQVTKGWIPESIVKDVRELDLLTYLERYEPYELVRLSPHVYSTRTHDSLKISNGKWYWWSRSVGGVSALDYLIHARGMDFYSAVRHISELMGRDTGLSNRGIGSNDIVKPRERARNPSIPFLLPTPNDNNDRMIDYLSRRCVHPAVLHSCIERRLIYEDVEHQNEILI